MSQIFNSHSQRHEPIKSFFFRAFSGTRVTPVWQEYEEGSPRFFVDQQIEQNIKSSSALFVLLSETVETLPFTRDWILWECGKADQKDIWVFEPYNSFRRINVVIPRFHHYVRYLPNRSWRDYINSIVRSYDDSGLLAWASAGSGIGAALSSEERTTAAILGAVGGAVMESIRRPKSPSGKMVQCFKCCFSYTVHIPNDSGEFRCAKCNNMMILLKESLSAHQLPAEPQQWLSR